jgi:hypothetical protein
MLKRSAIAVCTVAAMTIGCASNHEYFKAKVASKMLIDANLADKASASFEQVAEEHGEPAAIERSLAKARDELRDPDSAKIRNQFVAKYKGKRILCGEINGKNTYGAYTGYTKFIAGPSAAKVSDGGSMSADGRPIYVEIVKQICDQG